MVFCIKCERHLKGKESNCLRHKVLPWSKTEAQTCMFIFFQSTLPFHSNTSYLLKNCACHLLMAMKLLTLQPADKHMAFLQENPRFHLISALEVFSRLRVQGIQGFSTPNFENGCRGAFTPPTTWLLLHSHSCFGRWTGKIMQVKNNWLKLKKSGQFLDPTQSADSRSCLSDRRTCTIGDGGNRNDISHYWHQKHKLNHSHQHLS